MNGGPSHGDSSESCDRPWSSFSYENREYVICAGSSADKFSSASVSLLKKPGHAALDYPCFHSGPCWTIVRIVIASHPIRKTRVDVARFQSDVIVYPTARARVKWGAISRVVYRNRSYLSKCNELKRTCYLSTRFLMMIWSTAKT